ncbi:MAG: YfcE family phosphodiesterase [Thermosipho sp. (in: Bacteria)]|nr:YfcE family phosphodiesterase [Thermosipho sp. (in: thermotogales)]
MKKYLVISDLHIPTRNKEIHPKIIELAKKCDGIFALGDFVDIDTVIYLQSLNRNFFGVSGNMDYFEVKDYLPPQRIIKIGKFNIGLTHGSGSHFNIHHRIANWFPDDTNVILFGHSHIPLDLTYRGKRFINPGTAMKTFGIMEITDDTIKFNLIKL